MQSLRKNKALFITAMALPVFFFYLDKAIVSTIRDFHTYDITVYPWLETLDPLVNFISHGTTLVITAILLYVIGRFVNQRLYDVGRAMIIGFISSGIVAQVLKHLIGKARPRLTDDLVIIGPSFRSGYDSFPSGHTTVAFCLAYILSQHFPKFRIVFYLFAVIIGFERIENISHFPSDVLAGAIAGIVVAKLLSVRIVLPKKPETKAIM